MEILNSILTPLFIKLLVNSLNAGILVIAILIIRLLFRNKINARLLYCLWLILVIRLLLPFDLQVFNFLNFDRMTGIQFDYSTLRNFEFADLNSGINRSVSFFTFLNIFTFIWLAMIVILFLKKFIVINIFLKKLKDEKIFSNKKIILLFNACKKNINLHNKIELIETNLIKSPCVFGILKYKILIPSGLLHSLDENEIRCIFYHELSHIKNKDMIIEVITNLLKTIYFFNPLVAFAFNQMNRDCEYLCDANAVSLIENDSYTYGKTLIKTIESMKVSKLSRNITGIFSLLAAVNNTKNIKRRLKMICDYPKRSLLVSILSVFILLIICGFTFTGSVFAESNDKVKGINFIKPIDPQKITAKFGKGLDPITGEERFHSGIDLAKKSGSPVKASADGVVIKTDDDINNETGYGRYIIISHNDGYLTLYAKLSGIKVKEGQSLKAGDIIGLIGSTGRSTGPHLHFEIRKGSEPLNPEDYINFMK